MRILLALLVLWLSVIPPAVTADEAAMIEEVAKYPHPRKPPIVLSSLSPDGAKIAEARGGMHAGALRFQAITDGTLLMVHLPLPTRTSIWRLKLPE